MKLIKKIVSIRAIWYFLSLTSIFFLFLFATLNADQKEKSDTKEPVKVYFTSDISAEGVMKLYDKIKDGVHGKVGLKVHFGEAGNTYYVKPDLYKKLQEETNASFVETNVIYPGPRQKTESHIQLAKDHGFGYAPIDILDTKGELAIPAELNHFNEVWVGKEFKDYDTYIVCSHFKGHVMAGFGGAIKNIAMGMGSRLGKTSMHASHYPCIDIDKCINCGLCVQNCATNAITLQPLRVDPTKCVGCGKCIAVCPVNALTLQQKSSGKNLFLEKLADYAKGITDNTFMVYINFVNNVSPDCDCMSHPKKPFIHDVGIVASIDPVAIDKACLDLVNMAADSDDAFLHMNTVSGNHQLEYGEKIGLGTTNYKLINLD